jgi:hypothetical protein
VSGTIASIYKQYMGEHGGSRPGWDSPSFYQYYRVGLGSGSRSTSSDGLNSRPRLINPAIPTKP